MTAFTIAAVVGYKSSAWIVVGGLAGHGVFDALHGNVLENSRSALVVAGLSRHSPGDDGSGRDHRARVARRCGQPNHCVAGRGTKSSNLTFVAYSDRIATIGWTAVARRAAGRPARSATETAIADAPA